MKAAFAKFIGAQCGVTAQEHDFEAWLDQVERHAGHGPGVLASLISDAAIHAFEEGVSASDFALQIMARAA